MAQHLAALYKTDYVPEVAREIVQTNDFTVADILRIGQAQTERVQQKMKTAHRFLFCDTDLITTQIYCRHYLGTVPEQLFEWERQVVYDQYFLFDIDVAWVADGMRDQGSDAQRQKMFAMFKAELEKRQLPYTLVRGTYEMRIARVRSILDAL
jgi:HTH-type transcriptional repressor of NAD biosynthesis genes